MDKKAIIKQWKIVKKFDPYDPNYAKSQPSFLQKPQLGPAKAQSELTQTQSQKQPVEQKKAANPTPSNLSSPMDEEEPVEEPAGDQPPVSEHAKSLALLNKDDMTKYLGDLTAGKAALQASSLDMTKLVYFYKGSNSVCFLNNLLARLNQQLEELITS